MAYPIILSHGIARFDAVIPMTKYWSWIPNFLKNKGFAVHETNVDWAGSLALRGQELAHQIEQIMQNYGYEKVNIIAHSMGGLDARYAIVNMGIAHKVASLTTLATPHHGSAFADWLVKTQHLENLAHLLKAIGLDITGVRDLTLEACREQNILFDQFEQNNPHPIIYRAYAGKQPFSDIFWPLLPSYRIIKREEGDNDGFVSETSAKWKEEYYQSTKDLDHLNFLGWWEIAELDFFGGRTPGELESYVQDLYGEIVSSLP